MELNVDNRGRQVPVAPATTRAARMLLGACGRCAPPLLACGVRMHVVVSATWQAVSVVSRARSCAASVPLQRGTQQSDRLTQRVGMDSPFTADQMAWLAASFAVQPPLPSSVTPAASTSVGTAAGGSTPLSVPETGTSSAPTLTGSAPLLGTFELLRYVPTYVYSCVSWAWVVVRWGTTGVLEPRMARMGRRGQRLSHA